MPEPVLVLAQSNQTLLLRSDYSDQSAWAELCRLVEAPYEEGFRAYVTFVDDRMLAGRTLDDLIAVAESGGYQSFFFVADQEAIHGPEHAVLVVDLHEQRGRTFRVIPSQIWAVENNLSLSNMEFSTFADNADPDGVLRGFKD
jgi:hypothetical protein